MAAVHIATGANGALEVQEDRVIIRRSGFSSWVLMGSVGDKTIPISRLGAVQFKEPGLTNGYIQLAYSGSKEVKGGVFEAVKDENTVVFTSAQADDFRRARDLIEERMYRPAGQVSGLSVVEQIERLAALRDKGLLTDDEFNAQKSAVLAGRPSPPPATIAAPATTNPPAAGPPSYQQPSGCFGGLVAAVVGSGVLLMALVA